MDTFSRLSGDFNPLHLEARFAQDMGFDGPVVFGALIIAKVSCLLGMHLPGSGGMWTGLEMNFRNPLYVDEHATLIGKLQHLSEATGMLSLKLRVETESRCIATGSAETIVMKTDG